MFILKREVQKPVRTLVIRNVALVWSLSMLLAVFGGAVIAGVAAAGKPTVPRTVSASCRIQDPLACLAGLARSVAEALDPVPAFTVTVTPTVAVDCADAERAYWACAQDADCPIETFEAIADDVNFCQNPPRR